MKKDPDIQILESFDLEEKIAAQNQITRRVATRKFLEESCELAKMLPSRKKCLFIMHYSSGFSISEIAKLCRTSEGTVCRRLKEITRELNEMRECCDGKGTHESAKERLERDVQRKNRNRGLGLR
jgi:DNA-directed RNA polymerase specialized sigma24 family protein